MKNLLFLGALALSINAFGQVPNYVPTNGLVVWWPFNGNANDESGNGHNGTVNGATLTTDRFLNANSAYDFDGDNDNITIPHSVDFNSSELTISVWFSLNNSILQDVPSNNLDGQWIISKSPTNIAGGTKNRAFELSIDNGELLEPLTEPFYFQTGSSNQAQSTQHKLRGTKDIYSNNWYHGVYIISANNLRQYLNGVLIVDSLITDDFRINGQNILIGEYWGNLASNDRDFNGQIDDIGIWDRAITQCEINELYNAQQFIPHLLTLSDTTSACGALTTLDAGTDPAWASYLWNTTEDTQTISVSNPGLYSVEVTDTNGCIGYDTTLVSIIDPTIDQIDTNICIGDSVTLSVPYSSQSLACSHLPSYLQNGLIAYYPFCGNANDESGNGNDGTVNGATLTTDRFNNSNSAYSFDGVNDFVEVSHSNDFNVNTYTISAWVNANSFGDGSAGGQLGQRIIVSKRESTGWGSSYEFKVGKSTSTSNSIGASHTVAGTNISFGYSDEPLMNEGNWYFITYTQNTDSASLFFNGTFVNSVTSGDVGINNLNTFIGRRGNGSHPFDGIIDDVTMFNRVLTTAEIQQLYQLENYDITWSTGDTTSSITVQPTTTTTYSVTVSYGISSCVDDVTITVNDPQVNLGPDQDVCQGDSVLLDAGAGYDYYAWNTGDTTQTIYASQGGSYDATVGYETPVSNNYSLQFDGVDDYVEISTANTPLDFFNKNHLTISAWVKTSNLTNQQAIFINSDGTSLPSQQYAFKIEQGKLYFISGSGLFESNGVNVGSAQLAPSEWHYVSVTYDSLAIRFYVNGALDYENYVTDYFPSTPAGVAWIGKSFGSNNVPLDGALNRLSIWNAALSQEQIQQYMTCPPTGNEAGLIGYWNFEEGSGTTATDLTSNGNNGTLVNGPTWSTDVPNQVCTSCTASDTVVITELLPTTSSITEVNCDTYTAPDGQTYTSTGNYTAVIPNAVGCDSTITIDLTITNSTSGTDVQTACDTYTWATNGQTYIQTGQYTEVLTNQVGCDSTVTLNLTITNSNTGSETVTECDSYTWNTNGQTYTQTGQYTEVLTNQDGCDSTVTLNLTITNSNTGTDVQTACDTYTWIDGNTYTTSNNSATYTTSNTAGCDSTITLDLTITNSTSSTDTQTACDSYTWVDGTTYTQSGQYTEVLTNQNGCDSTVTLILTITNSNTGSETVTECDSYTWSTNGQTYTQTGQYTSVLTNQDGCDSTVTLNLTITNSNTGSETVTACDSYTWSTNGQTYTQTGQYTSVLTNQDGCDSTVTLNLTISPTPDNSITQNGASLTATQTGATYQWIDCDNFNAPITGEVNQVFFPSLSGNYAVEVTIGDCSSTSECRLVDFTGIDEIESLISVHPNPTKDEVTLSIGAELLGTGFVVTDNAGRIILTDAFKSTEQKVNLSVFDNGVYFIRTDKESPVKIIKQ